MTALILAAEMFCVVALIVHIASIAVVLSRVRRTASGTLYADAAVSIIRPVSGVENFCEVTLASAFYLTHPRYEIIFCAAKAADPVVPMVSRLIAAHPEIPARLLIGNDHISTNPKLNNVVKGWAAAKHAWVVMADSNVLLPRDYLGRLLGKWQRDTGLVSSPAIGSSPDGIWGELECAFLNTYQARWQLFADSVGLGFAQGKTMMYRKELIESSGGIRALAAELAEDAASTKLVRRLGLRVRVVDRPISQPLGRRTATEVWRRQVRWARLRRDTFMLYFLPELLAGGVLPLAACTIVAAAHYLPIAGTLAAYAALWYAAEAILAVAAGWHRSWRSPLAWLVRDLLIPVLWLASWMRNDFVWRENTMHITNRRSPA
jgi:ceramide glucosyltransferase